MPRKRVEILGVPVDAFDERSLPEAVDALVAAPGSATLAPVNIDIMNRASEDPALRAFLAGADIVYADGVGVVLGSHLLGDPLPTRVTSIRLLWSLCERWAGGQRSLYFLGGPPGTAERAVEAIHARYPGVRIAGLHRGHLSPEEERQVLKEIQALRPDVLCVGFGTPLQERFLDTYRSDLEGVPLLWPVGALTTHVAGLVPRAPRWMRRLWLEWLWRLGLEPRRLWRRYLIGNVTFVARVVASRLTGDRTRPQGLDGRRTRA